MRICALTASILLTIMPASLLSSEAIKKSEDIKVEAPAADLMDKITILEIKLERITDQNKRKNIEREYNELMDVYKANVIEDENVSELHEQLLSVNMNLWDLEDATREKERNKTFDDEFALQVLTIINTNDERARIKRAINEYVGSSIIEEKSYADIVIRQPEQTENSQRHVSLEIPVPLGELIDRYVILEIKEQNIFDESKRAHIEKELCLYKDMIQSLLDPEDKEFIQFKEELFQANKEMWDIQNAMREKRESRLFDNEFKELGRGVYHANDKRFKAKCKINKHFGSALVEEKCYAEY